VTGLATVQREPEIVSSADEGMGRRRETSQKSLPAEVRAVLRIVT